MFQVTALYQGNEEIGYAEGEDAADVLLEVRESIPCVYDTALVTFEVRYEVSA